jgi:hypothetical protein
VTQPFIVGAGLTGLLAAHAWPRMAVLEAAPGPAAAHRALLRFRTDAVSHLTGIAFRKVRVRKAIVSRGVFAEPSIRLANQYSLKIAGRLLPDRSIWNIEPADRFIAPPDFYEQMVDAVGARIFWGEAADIAGAAAARATMICTAPLPVTLGALGVNTNIAFERSAIVVDRLRVPRADVFQTVYFPEDDTPVYRASITGDLLIVESIGADGPDPTDIAKVLDAFGVPEADQIDRAEQRYGKIAPIEDDATRRALLFSLTRDYGVYSLGRFAIWRNVLLDDVVGDIASIKRMMAADAYTRRLAEAAS